MSVCTIHFKFLFHSNHRSITKLAISLNNKPRVWESSSIKPSGGCNVIYDNYYATVALIVPIYTDFVLILY